jgi:hypothetical protein
VSKARFTCLQVIGNHAAVSGTIRHKANLESAISWHGLRPLK